MDLKKKIGPLPLWGWVAVVGGALVVFLIIRHEQSSSSSSTSNSLNQVDPNNPLGLTYAEEQQDEAAGIDPNTGASYASESSAGLYDTGLGDTGGGGSGSSGTADTGSGYLTDASVTQDFENALAASGFTPNGSSTTTPTQTFAGEVNDVTGVLNGLGLNLAITPTSSAATKTSSAASSSSKLPAPKLSPGATRAPYGHNKPAAPAGYTAIGQGNGYWEFVPNKISATKPPSKPPSKPKVLTANQEANRRNG